VPARARIAIPLALIALVIAVAAVVWFVRRPERAAVTPGPELHTAVPLAALEHASGWLDSAPWTADSLAGKSVLLVVWSDTDPVSLSVLPEAEAWQHAFGRFGLRVVGVHVPQYSFAADSAVPARALRRIGVHLPVALDGGLEISTQLGMGETLPLWVLADRAGRLEYRAEGARTPAVAAAIAELLQREHPESGIAPGVATVATEPMAVRRVFCGASRVGAGPLAHATPGRTETYTAEFRYQEEGEAYTPYPVGRWTPTAEGLTAARGGASDFVSIRYDGGTAEVVMGAGEAARTPVKVWVLSDDAWVPEAQRGADIEADTRGATYVEVSETRLYSIARGGGRHVLKLSPEAPGVTIHELAFVPE
jgi:hypothetical protein